LSSGLSIRTSADLGNRLGLEIPAALQRGILELAYKLGEKQAAWHFTQSRDVEEGHSKLYKSAMSDMVSDRVTTYYVCSVCGYVSDGVLPDECPVCGAKRGRNSSTSNEVEASECRILFSARRRLRLDHRGLKPRAAGHARSPAALPISF